MEGRFNLIKNDEPEIEKRILPRFPFSYLTFKAKDSGKVFEVKDISYLGMQVALRDGGHSYKVEDHAEGTLYWRGKSLDINGPVRWVSGHGVGIEFDKNTDIDKSLKDFLCLDNLVRGLRPLHHKNMQLDLPSNLKYWLRSDGPVEIFVWQHGDGELARFQVILMDNFIEWEDGKGLKTGRILQVDDKEMALNTVDELTFELDNSADREKVQFAKSVISQVPFQFLPQEDNRFLTMKLSG